MKQTITLYLLFGMIMADSVLADITIQNNTFCNVITEETRHTFKQEIFCDYARNSSNITPTKPHFSSSSGGGGGGGFALYCGANESFNRTTMRCDPNPAAIREMVPFPKPSELTTKEYLFVAIVTAVTIIVVVAGLIAVISGSKKVK